MGWFFSQNWITKKDVAAFLQSTERFGTGYTLLRASVVGNNHWYLCLEDKSGDTYIGLDLMSNSKDDGWGYKDLSEFAGPVEVNCPLTYLEQVTETVNEYAKQWREKVRKYHADKKARIKYAAEVIAVYDGKEYQLLVSAGKRQGWHVKCLSTQNVYRMNAQQLNKAELKQPN